MAILLTCLIALLILDHSLRNKRFNMLYYKNNHRFSVAVVIRHYHEGLEKLFDVAQKSVHSFVFISVNGAVDPVDYPDHVITTLEIDKDVHHLSTRTKVLSEGYHHAYAYLNNEFLLFMDSEIDIRSHKTLDFMANNLVEHQCLTAKLTIERETFSESHTLFYDLYRDIKVPKERINFGFFAIKRSTYELANSQEKQYVAVEEFEKDINRKNVSVIPINHGETLFRVIGDRSFKSQLKQFINEIVCADRLVGLERLLLFLVAFHVFYGWMIYDFNWFFIFAYLIIHLLLAVVMKPFTYQLLYVFLLAPFLMLWFNGVMLYALAKRFLMKRRHKEASHDYEETIEEITSEEYDEDDKSE